MDRSTLHDRDQHLGISPAAIPSMVIAALLLLSIALGAGHFHASESSTALTARPMLSCCSHGHGAGCLETAVSPEASTGAACQQINDGAVLDASAIILEMGPSGCWAAGLDAVADDAFRTLPRQPRAPPVA